MKPSRLSLLSLSLALVLAACGGASAAPTSVPTTAAKAADATKAPEATKAPAATTAPAATAAAQAKASGAPVEIRMIWYNDGNEGEVMRDLLNRFEKENPNIKVVMDTVAFKDLPNILQAQVESGKGPDIARLTNQAPFIGKYLDLRPYLKDANAWEANWPPLVLAALRKADDKKGLYGFASQFTVSGPFINKTLFKQAGVPIPSDTSDKVTWDQWLEAATKVAKATNTPYAIAIDRSGHRFWGPAMSLGANFIDPDLNATNWKIDTPGFRKAAQMLIDWHKNKLTPAEVWAGGGGGYAAGNDFFVNGQLVMYFSGSWQVQQFTKTIGDKFEWTPVPNPCSDGGCTGMPGGAYITAFASTTHPAETAKVMEFMSRDDILEEFSARSLFIPAHLGLAKKGLNFPASKDALNVFLKEVPKMTQEAYTLNYHAQGPILNTEMRDRLSQVIVGELTLDQAIQKIQEKMDSLNKK